MIYCKSKGYDWGGLYDKFRRVSCWCCPLQPMSHLRTLYREFPDLWARLEDMDARMRQDPEVNDRPFKGEHTVAELSARFAREMKAEREQRTLEGWA